MITSLRIKNIQSHKDSELIFSPGINVIVGSSNNGKSSIMRAVNWVVRNRPMGIDVLCSHWAIDDKGNQKEEMAVTIGTGDSTITRYRTKNKNQYQINKTILNVVKSDVPEIVSETLALAEANMQAQQDSPFLLSLSNADVGRYFNRIVNLDIIDSVLSNAETRRKRTNHALTSVDTEISELEKGIGEYKWLERAEVLFTKHNNVSEKYAVLIKRKERLQNYLDKHTKLSFEISQYALLEKLKKILKEYTAQSAILEQLEGRLYHVEAQIEKYSQYNRCTVFDFSTAKELIDRIASAEKKIKEIGEQIENINYVTTEHGKLKNLIQQDHVAIAENKKLLPDVCPLCGAVMGDSQ